MKTVKQLLEGITTKRLHGPEESHEGYAYHATDLYGAHDIAESGIKTFKPWHGTDQDTWPDGSTKKRNYFGTSAEHSWQFRPEEGPGVLLRVHRSKHAMNVEQGTGDLYSNKTVHPDHIEVLADNNEWHPIKRLLDKE